MYPKQNTTQKTALNSISLDDAYTDFILSRQALLRSKNTILFYDFTAGMFKKWLVGKIDSLKELQVKHVREYLAELAAKGKSDGTISDHAKGIRVLVRFWYSENYIDLPIIFQIPKPAKKRLLTLNAETLKMLLSMLTVKEKAIVMVLADSGLRRAEACNLCWADINMNSGQVFVLKGKGGKPRATKIGANARRALLKYRRTLTNVTPKSPVFQTRSGTKYSGQGMRQVFETISIRTSIKVTVHSLRRTFTILSLRAGMSALHVKGLGGWEGLEMVEHYAQLEEDDFMQAHQEHSPIDNLK